MCIRDSVYIFRDTAIWKFRKFGLKCLFRPKKSCFGEFWPLNFTFYHRDPQKALLCAETRVLSPHWSWSVLRCDLDARRSVPKKKEPKVSQNSPFFADPLPVVPHQPNFACMVVSRIIFLVLSFRKIGWKCVSSGGRIFGFAIDLLHRLYNSLLHNPWSSVAEIDQSVRSIVVNSHTINYKMLFAVRSAVWSGREAKRTKKRKNALICRRPQSKFTTHGGIKNAKNYMHCITHVVCTQFNPAPPVSILAARSDNRTACDKRTRVIPLDAP